MTLAIDSSDHVDDFAGFLEQSLDSDLDFDSDNDIGYTERSKKMSKVENSNHGFAAISEEEVLELQGVIDDGCAHSAGSYKDMCLLCGERLDQNENNNINKELRPYSRDEIDSNTKLLLGQRKLHLVLDLDHTLLNTTPVSLINLISPQEGYLLETDSEADHSLQNVFTVRTPHMHLLTKLRPFVRAFLKEASEIFEMSVYTMGNRRYAKEMVKLLDPKGKYFGDRVVSRDDSPRKLEKCLDFVCAKDTAVLVLDDTQEVWAQRDQDNVILMRRYLFFRHSLDSFGLESCISLSEMRTDESDEQPYLADILGLLKRIHAMFFDGGNVVDRDVRQVIKTVRSEVLRGCKIAFGCVLASKDQAYLWNMAERMGAACSTEVTDPSVTHVIETGDNYYTQNTQWAENENKFLVHPYWIQGANYMWQKLPEDMFSIRRIEEVTSMYTSDLQL